MDSNVYCESPADEIPSMSALWDSLMRFPEPSGYLLFTFSRCGPIVAIGPRTGGIVIVSSEREEGEDDRQYEDRVETNGQVAALFQKSGLPVVPALGTPEAIRELGWSAIESQDEEETDASVILGTMGLLETNGRFKWNHCGIDPLKERRLVRSRALEAPTGQNLSRGYLSFVDVMLPPAAANEGEVPITVPAMILMRDGSLSVVFGTDSAAEIGTVVGKCFSAIGALTAALQAVAPDIAAGADRLLRPVVVSNETPPAPLASLVVSKTRYWTMMEAEGQSITPDPMPPSVLRMLQSIETVSGAASPSSKPPVVDIVPSSPATKPPENDAVRVSTQIGSLRHIPEMRASDIDIMAEGFGAAFLQVVGNRRVFVAETPVTTADIWLPYGMLPALLAYTVMEWTPVAAGTKMGLGVLLLSEQDSILSYRVGGLSEQRNRLLMLAVAESSRRLIDGDRVDFVPPLIALQRCLRKGGHRSEKVDFLLRGIHEHGLNGAFEVNDMTPSIGAA